MDWGQGSDLAAREQLREKKKKNQNRKKHVAVTDERSPGERHRVRARTRGQPRTGRLGDVRSRGEPLWGVCPAAAALRKPQSCVSGKINLHSCLFS